MNRTKTLAAAAVVGIASLSLAGMAEAKPVKKPVKCHVINSHGKKVWAKCQTKSGLPGKAGKPGVGATGAAGTNGTSTAPPVRTGQRHERHERCRRQPGGSWRPR
jgi:hypothetical protein